MVDICTLLPLRGVWHPARGMNPAIEVRATASPASSPASRPAGPVATWSPGGQRGGGRPPRGGVIDGQGGHHRH